ncbi:hypothetical protein GGG16DRAFT_47439 [Schizophyllum commune]
MSFDVITKHFDNGRARAPEDEVYAILSSRYRALFGAAGVVAYTGYTLAARGRTAVSLGGLVRTTAVCSVPAFVSGVVESRWRCSGLDHQERQIFLSRLQKDRTMTLPGPFTNLGMLVGYMACFALLWKRRPVPLLLDGLVDPEKYVRTHSPLRRAILKGVDWVFVPIAFGGVGGLVYYAKRGIEELWPSSPVVDMAGPKSKVRQRLAAAKERVQDGLSVPVKLRWLRDYAMIQAGAGLKVISSVSWLAIPATIVFMRGTSGAKHLLIQKCVRNAGLLGAFGLVSVLPALHALLVFELDGRAKEYRKDLKSSLGFQLWDRYIATGALFGGSLLPPLLVNGAPKAYLVNCLPNGKFVYSLRNMGILGAGGIAVGAGLGSIAFLLGKA